MGNTCKSMADSCQCMEKPLHYCKVITLQLIKINEKKDLKLYFTLDFSDNYNTLNFVSPQVLQNILDTEKDYAKELQSLLVTYLRPLQSNNQ